MFKFCDFAILFCDSQVQSCGAESHPHGVTRCPISPCPHCPSSQKKLCTLCTLKKKNLPPPTLSAEGVVDRAGHYLPSRPTHSATFPRAPFFTIQKWTPSRKGGGGCIQTEKERPCMCFLFFAHTSGWLFFCGTPIGSGYHRVVVRVQI